jgi:hypothetical protein
MGVLAKYRPFLLLLLAALPGACIDEVQLPIRNDNRQLVVEGLISDEKPPYTVRLTYTGTFRTGRVAPASLAVTGARVSITDNTGGGVLLKPVLQEPGMYQTADSTYTGQAGRSYTLTVVTPEGKTYRSQAELLQPVPPIEKLSAAFQEVADNSRPSGYRVLADTRDPAATENYYRWTAYGISRRVSVGKPRGTLGLCCYNCWVPTYTNSVNIFADDQVNGNPIKGLEVFFVPYYAQGRLYVEVSQYSLSRAAYQFWKRYQEQQTRVGSILDPLPAPIAGNVANADNPADRALGYFGASAVTRRRLLIPADTLRLFPDYYPEFIKPGDCRLAYPNASFDPPAGW